MIPNWVQSQHRIFLKWCNVHLEPENPPISNVSEDFKNGIALCHLIEAITGSKLGKIHLTPKLIESYGNIDLALGHLRATGVKLEMVGPGDFVEGNLKMILGFIWQLILKFTVGTINEGGVSASDGLLLWCKRGVEPYGVVIEDFGDQWKDGLAFCALIDRYVPNSLDFDKLDKSDPRKCLEQALEVASQKGIPSLLDVQDILNRPDEKSLVTYLAYWHHAFAPLDRLEAAGRNVEAFCNISSIAAKLRQEYESQIRELLSQIKLQRKYWLKELDSMAEEKFLKYKSHTKNNWLKQKLKIAQLFGDLNAKLSTYRMVAYSPAPELSVQFLNDQWLHLQEAELKYTKRLSDHLEAQRESIRTDFANLANELANDLHRVTQQISALSGELDSQLEQILVQNSQVSSLEPKLKSLKELSECCTSRGITTSGRTVHTFESLKYELELVEQTYHSKLSFIENQIAAVSVGQVQPDLLDEFETVFRHFDRRGSNCLTYDEFASALNALDISYSNEEMRLAFETCAEQDAVSFRRFVEYMTGLSESDPTPEQVRKSFRDIAKEKPYILRADLEDALLRNETIEHLISLMPSTEQGYDYNAYLDKLQCL